MSDQSDFRDRIEQANALVREAFAMLPFDHPVGCVQWLPISEVRANDYNPNAVAHHEMRLLHTSISSDGYTQPIVAMYDEEREDWVIVDGFHRWTVAKRYEDISASTGGYVPVVVIDKPVADRIASTVRHNRARGQHSVAGMGNLVFSMLQEGQTDVEICHKLGLEAEELARLKHITGYSKLYADTSYSKPVLTTSQLKAKAAYAKEHPDEQVPSNF